jgi:hypothetical protein
VPISSVSKILVAPLISPLPLGALSFGQFMPIHRLAADSLRRGVGLLATWLVVGCGRLGYETVEASGPSLVSSMQTHTAASAASASAPGATTSAASGATPTTASVAVEATASVAPSAPAPSSPAAASSADAGVVPSADPVVMPDAALVPDVSDAAMLADAEVDSGVSPDAASAADASVPYTGMPSPCASVTGAWTLSAPEHLSALSSGGWEGA